MTRPVKETSQPSEPDENVRTRKQICVVVTEDPFLQEMCAPSHLMSQELCGLLGAWIWDDKHRLLRSVCPSDSREHQKHHQG